MGGCSDGSLVIDLKYENLSAFCNFCNFVGHDITTCRKKKAAEGKDKDGKEVAAPAGAGQGQVSGAKPSHVQRVWKKKDNSDIPQVTSAVMTYNRFAALPEEVEEGEANQVDNMGRREDEDGFIENCSDSDSSTEELALQIAQGSMKEPQENESHADLAARQIELEMRKARIVEVLKKQKVLDKTGGAGGSAKATGLDTFVNTLDGVIKDGGKVTDFEIDPGDFVNTRTMSNMAAKRWADQVEEEEGNLLGHQAHQ